MTAGRLLALACLALPSSALAAPWGYRPPGELVSGSGAGRVDQTVYAPGLRFPIEEGPAFANSQVWGRGGSAGGGGSQCDAQNFTYPWHDNYCETRSWDMPLCPSGTGHQGQDVRASDCTAGVHWTVAVTDGMITSIGSYSVYLTADDGTRYDYLHMSNVAVAVGQRVTRGQHMGKVSNQFGGSSTTVHLHFNIRQNVAGVGMVYVPPYLSLIQAYEDLTGLGGAPDAPLGAPDAAARPDARPAPTLPPDAGDPAPLSGDATGGCRVAAGAPASGPLLVGLGVLVSRARRRR